MSEIFAQTRAVYASAEGAAAYIAKERPVAEARNASAWALLEGMDLTGKRVLDLGCGFGRDVAEFRRRGAEAYGVDGSPALLEEARRRHGHAKWWFENGLDELVEMPRVGPFDVIWCYAVLLHFPREAVPGLLARWAGWLKPGGVLIVATQQGEGEAVSVSMGKAFARAMVFHQPEQVLDMVRDLPLTCDLIDTLEPFVTATGSKTNPLLRMRFRKSPAA